MSKSRQSSSEKNVTVEGEAVGQAEAQFFGRKAERPGQHGRRAGPRDRLELNSSEGERNARASVTAEWSSGILFLSVGERNVRVSRSPNEAADPAENQ